MDMGITWACSSSTAMKKEALDSGLDSVDCVRICRSSSWIVPICMFSSKTSHCTTVIKLVLESSGMGLMWHWPSWWWVVQQLPGGRPCRPLWQCWQSWIFASFLWTYQKRNVQQVPLKCTLWTLHSSINPFFASPPLCALSLLVEAKRFDMVVLDSG